MLQAVFVFEGSRFGYFLKGSHQPRSRGGAVLLPLPFAFGAPLQARVADLRAEPLNRDARDKSGVRCSAPGALGPSPRFSPDLFFRGRPCFHLRVFLNIDGGDPNHFVEGPPRPHQSARVVYETGCFLY